MPFITALLTGIGVAAATAGTAEGIKSSSDQQGLQQQGLNQQEKIANQEQQDKQQIFKQLSDFFSPYLKSGSPFLQNIQSATAGQEATQGNNAAGQFREQVGQAGTGYGGGGSMAAGLANIGGQQATSSASNYLTDLLNNEQVKFQAAQGLNSAGQMAGSPQNQPNVSTQLQPANLGSSIFGASQLLNGVANQTKPAPAPTPITPPTVSGNTGSYAAGG